MTSPAVHFATPDVTEDEDAKLVTMLPPSSSPHRTPLKTKTRSSPPPTPLWGRDSGTAHVLIEEDGATRWRLALTSHGEPESSRTSRPRKQGRDKHVNWLLMHACVRTRPSPSAYVKIDGPLTHLRILPRGAVRLG